MLVTVSRSHPKIILCMPQVPSPSFSFFMEEGSCLYWWLSVSIRHRTQSKVSSNTGHLAGFTLYRNHLHTLWTCQGVVASAWPTGTGSSDPELFFVFSWNPPWPPLDLWLLCPSNAVEVCCPAWCAHLPHWQWSPWLHRKYGGELTHPIQSTNGKATKACYLLLWRRQCQVLVCPPASASCGRSHQKYQSYRDALVHVMGQHWPHLLAGVGMPGQST